jgi:S1-C subfamily serine protease
MITGGIPEEVIGDIADALNQVAAAQLRLHEQSVREGWRDTDRYNRALQEIPNGLDVIRSRFGEGIYDRYLYSTYAPNRLVVGSVPAGSHAMEAGLRPGDIVISVDGQRVFGANDLASAIEPAGGADVALTVQRSMRLDTRRLQRPALLGTTWQNACINPNHA